MRTDTTTVSPGAKVCELALGGDLLGLLALELLDKVHGRCPVGGSRGVLAAPAAKING
jgi:hypothetical protein